MDSLVPNRRKIVNTKHSNKTLDLNLMVLGETKNQATLVTSNVGQFPKFGEN